MLCRHALDTAVLFFLVYFPLAVLICMQLVGCGDARYTQALFPALYCPAQSAM